MITTIDEAGGVQEFVSSGFTAEEHEAFITSQDGPRLWAHFRDLPGPIRLTDLPAFVSSLGYGADLLPARTFQGTPMRHRDAQVGNLFLAEKEGGPEFTAEDEKVMVLFGSLAATAVANARTHSDEQRARADLEALVETSPVGVAVFDSGSGRPVSFNREARRIMENLRTAGRPLEQLHRGIGGGHHAGPLVDRARTTFLSGGVRHTVLIDLPPDLPRVMADRRPIDGVRDTEVAVAQRGQGHDLRIPAAARLEREGHGRRQPGAQLRAEAAHQAR